MSVVIQLAFVDHLTPLMKIVEGLIAQGIPADDVPPLPERLVLIPVSRIPSAAKCTVFLLPSPELCEWLGALSSAADARLSRPKERP